MPKLSPNKPSNRELPFGEPNKVRPPSVRYWHWHNGRQASPILTQDEARIPGYPRIHFQTQSEIWFSILQRKLLTPNHFESLGALEAAIQAFIACRNETAKPIQWTYTFEKLEKKLGVH